MPMRRDIAAAAALAGDGDILTEDEDVPTPEEAVAREFRAAAFARLKLLNPHILLRTAQEDLRHTAGHLAAPLDRDGLPGRVPRLLEAARLMVVGQYSPRGFRALVSYYDIFAHAAYARAAALGVSVEWEAAAAALALPRTSTELLAAAGLPPPPPPELVGLPAPQGLRYVANLDSLQHPRFGPWPPVPDFPTGTIPRCDRAAVEAWLGGMLARGQIGDLDVHLLLAERASRAGSLADLDDWANRYVAHLLTPADRRSLADACLGLFVGPTAPSPTDGEPPAGGGAPSPPSDPTAPVPILPRPEPAPPPPEPEPEPIERTAIPNGTLVTHAGSAGRVWIISRGRRREIVMLRTPGDVFAACGYDLHQVQTFPVRAVLAMPAGPDVTGPPDCPFGRRVLPPKPPPPDRNGTELPPRRGRLMPLLLVAGGLGAVWLIAGRQGGEAVRARPP